MYQFKNQLIFVTFSLVLVTGGAGFIGYHASRRLAGLGYEVVVLDSFLSRGVSDDSIRLMRADNLKRKGIIAINHSSSFN